MKPNRSPREEFRCTQCGALLGLFTEICLDIRRRDLQVAVEGKASIVCYRCGKLNVVVHPAQSLAAARNERVAAL
jgi:hypothetical protein